MTKRTKTWKIGEYCAGGVIRAKSCGELVKLEIRDHNTGKLYSTDNLLNYSAFGRIHEGQIFAFLTMYTTPYHADKVLQWIKQKVWGLA
ncbi:MAG: hypothetical protein EBZ61_10515 [Micrococcales bacterium]|nr:hypothetical protein [Micrococcales bacterium]